MAIFENKKVKSLPEQVQDNKEKIETIEAFDTAIEPRVKAIEDEMTLVANYVEYQVDGSQLIIKVNDKPRVIVEEGLVGLGDLDNGSVVGVNVDTGYTQVIGQNSANVLLADESAGLHVESEKVNIFAGSNSGLQLDDSNETAIIGANNGVSLTTNDTINQFLFDDNGDIILTKANNSGYFFKCKDSNDVDVEFQFDPNNKQVKIDGVPVGGGSSTLYEHNIVLKTSTLYLTLKLVNDDSTSYNGDWAKVKQAIYNAGYRTYNNYLMLGGYYDNAGVITPPTGLFCTSVNSCILDVVNLASINLSIADANTKDLVRTL